MLVLGVPFDPIPLKAFAPVLFPGLSYNQWVALYPGLPDTTPGAIPQRDGISNLLKYFQGNDPTVAGPFDSTSVDATTDQLVLRFRKSKSLSGVTSKVEWSADLLTWQTGGVTYDPEQDFGNYLQGTARVSRAGDAKIFLRLRVNLNQARPASGKTPAKHGQR